MAFYSPVRGRVAALALSATLALAVMIPGAARAETQRLSSGPDGEVIFVTPSGNIGCIYIPAGGTSVYESADGQAELQCDRVEPSYVTVILGAKTRAKRINEPGEQGCCSLDQPLDYGNSWSEGPFTCLSSKTGLTCSSRAGHGFFISKAKIEVH